MQLVINCQREVLPEINVKLLIMKPKISSAFATLMLFVICCLYANSSVAARDSGTTIDQLIQGTVKDETGAPLIGVTISVKSDPGTGTISDIDGNYQLNVPDGNAVLVFSYIGYLTQEEVINGRSRIDLNMVPNINQLNEVVVIGYGTQRKSDLTGALISAPLESFEESPNTNIL